MEQHPFLAALIDEVETSARAYLAERAVGIGGPGAHVAEAAAAALTAAQQLCRALEREHELAVRKRLAG